MNLALRYLLLAMGWTSLGLGMAGLVVPVLPTVPFVLLAAACFMRSSDRLYRWVISHPRFGKQCEDYLNGSGIPRRAKVVALATLWTSVLGTLAIAAPPGWVSATLLAIAAAVSFYLFRLPEAAGSEEA